MTFVVNAIKQDPEQKLAVEFLLDIESQLLARKIMEKTGLVLLSLKEYTNETTTYGPLYLKFSYDTDSVQIVGNKNMQLKDLCTIFISLGLEVVDINYFQNPQSPDEVKKLIADCMSEYQASQNQKRLAAQQEQDSERKIYYGNQGLDKAKGVITWAVDKVTQLLEEKGAYISSRDLRTIKERIEELKKMRMGTNYEKIRDMLQELFVMVDRIEEDYYAGVQDQGTALFEGTCVTNMDVERHVSILEKVQQQQQFGGTVSPQRKDYVAFGQNLLFLFFLKKDLFAAFQRLPVLLYACFDLLILAVMMIIIFLGIYIVLNKILVLGNPLGSVYYALVSFGWFGLLTYGASFLKRRSFLFQLLLLIGLFVAYWLLLPVIEHSFALG